MAITPAGSTPTSTQARQTQEATEPTTAAKATTPNAPPEAAVNPGWGAKTPQALQAAKEKAMALAGGAKDALAAKGAQIREQLTQRAGEILATMAPSSYHLNPNVQPTAVPLLTVAEQILKSPKADEMIGGLVKSMKDMTGYEPSPQEIAMAKASPEALSHLFELKPSQLAAGFTMVGDAVAMKDKLQGRTPEPPKQYLPQKFDFGKIDDPSLGIKAAKESTWKEIAPGLWRGENPAGVSDSVHQRNTVMAEVFQRLSTNDGKPAGEQFSVNVGGKEHRSVESFTKALEAQGYKVEARFEQRVANFATLGVPVPGSTGNPPPMMHIAAPVMMRTGINGPDGKEVIMPAMHAEATFTISHPDKPDFQADIRFFQGKDTTGFFPKTDMEVPKWLGLDVQRKVTDTKQAMEILNTAGTLGDMLQDTAKKLGLPNDGYARTGVCQDSVGVLMQSAFGKPRKDGKPEDVVATQWPFLQNDKYTLPELEARRKTAPPSEQKRLDRLIAAYKALPNDTEPSPSAETRMLQSIPWAKGKATFASTEVGREVLEARRAAQPKR